MTSLVVKPPLSPKMWLKRLERCVSRRFTDVRDRLASHPRAWGLPNLPGNRRDRHHQLHSSRRDLGYWVAFHDVLGTYPPAFVFINPDPTIEYTSLTTTTQSDCPALHCILYPTRLCRRLPQRSQTLTSHDLSNFSTKGATPLAAHRRPSIPSPNTQFSLLPPVRHDSLTCQRSLRTARISSLHLRPWIQVITSTSWKYSLTRPS